MSEKLKPCPFCGPGSPVNIVMQHNPEGGWLYEIVCQGCSVTMPCDDSEADAIADWNRRVPDLPQTGQEQFRQIKAFAEVINERNFLDIALHIKRQADDGLAALSPSPPKPGEAPTDQQFDNDLADDAPFRSPKAGVQK